jgi:S1-C subfamily serine protease
MREPPNSSLGKTIASHLVTSLLTLMLVIVFFGDFSGGRRPVVAQIRGRARTQPPPVPVPADPSAPAVPAADLGSGAPALPEDVLKDLDPDERNNVRVYNAANKGVVNITTETEVSGFFGDETSTGTGSGFVIDKEGHILTNFHVIHGDDASRISIRVTLFDE